MGMFDYVRCKYPLPVDEKIAKLLEKEEFQSKSLDCCTEEYTITADGALVRANWDAEAQDWGEAAPFSLHGELEFYTYLETDPDAEEPYMITFLAMFNNGQLQSIDRIDKHGFTGWVCTFRKGGFYSVVRAVSLQAAASTCEKQYEQFMENENDR